MSKTRAEDQRQFRERKREAGMVLKQIFVWPKDWPAIKRYIDRLNGRKT